MRYVSGLGYYSSEGRDSELRGPPTDPGGTIGEEIQRALECGARHLKQIDAKGQSWHDKPVVSLRPEGVAHPRHKPDDLHRSYDHQDINCSTPPSPPRRRFWIFCDSSRSITPFPQALVQMPGQQTACTPWPRTPSDARSAVQKCRRYSQRPPKPPRPPKAPNPTMRLIAGCEQGRQLPAWRALGINERLTRRVVRH